MLSWKYLKRNAFLNSTNICSFARVCALLTLFELIIFPSCKDLAALDTSFSIFTELHEHITFPLFFLAYAKELVGKYSLLLSEWFTKWPDTNVAISEVKLTKLLSIYTVAVKSTGCARIHLYASAFVRKLLSTAHVCKLLSHREQQELQTFCATIEVHACYWDAGALDYESQSATALLTELETPLIRSQNILCNWTMFGCLQSCFLSLLQRTSPIYRLSLSFQMDFFRRCGRDIYHRLSYPTTLLSQT